MTSQLSCDWYDQVAEWFHVILHAVFQILLYSQSITIFHWYLISLLCWILVKSTSSSTRVATFQQDEIPCASSEFSLCYINFPCVLMHKNC